jgi:hypothetical protein
MSALMKVASAGVNSYCMESCLPHTGNFKDWITLESGQPDPWTNSFYHLKVKETPVKIFISPHSMVIRGY